MEDLGQSWLFPSLEGMQVKQRLKGMAAKLSQFFGTFVISLWTIAL
jgi:hypothetical protein